METVVWKKPDLSGKAAVVTGASRGGGKGIALSLGEAGATVYVTGRSTRGSGSAADRNRETIEDTAEAVTARGGLGIPVCCDHAVDAEVEAIFEQAKKEQGKLDLLVNNAWGGYEGYDDADFQAPFWQQPLARWDKMLTIGLRSTMVASRYAMSVFLPQRHGLIVNTTANVELGEFHGSVFYDTVKKAIQRMTYGMGENLRTHETGVSAVVLAPGWMRTEAVMRHFGMEPGDPDFLRVAAFSQTESVEYIGRAVASLADDPAVAVKSGQLLEVGDLAKEYGFTDVDGRQLSPFRI